MKRLSILLLITTLFTACDNITNPYYGAEDNENANNSTHKYAGRIEVPALNDEDIFITHTTTVNGKEYITYSISQNPERQHCRWTAFTFDSYNKEINWKRDNWDNTEWGGDPFQSTPSLPEDAEMTKQQINNNGFVRGHIVASYDRVYSKDANEQTFYYSNISPMHSRFNTGAWNDCESMIQSLARSKDFRDTLYVVKGATIRDGEYRTVRSCPTVPNYYFMALLWLKNNTYEAIGLLFKHVNGVSKTEACSIDYLEEFTGIDMFCNIPDRVENIVESIYRPGKWPGLYDYTDLGK